MRTENEIKNLLLDFAREDDRIRAVILNGSRANLNIKPDKYQDFDVVFIVNHIESFISDAHWTDILGEIVIRQLPYEMTYGETVEPDVERKNGYTYLMQFKDGNRIDLTLFPLEFLESNYKADSLTIVWLDKDGLFREIPDSNDSDYHIRKPSEKEFLDTCNEFWWVSTYIAKGLLRKEITYAKETLEIYVRPMFMKMIEWKIGCDNDFSVSFGKGGKQMKQFLPKDLYERILQTYSDADLESNWKSLFVMTDLFTSFSKEVAEKLNFDINLPEQKNTVDYLQEKYNERDSSLKPIKKNIKQVFHTLSYIQYPLLIIGLFLIIKPLFQGFDYLSSNPEYLFRTYNYALIFLGLTLSFGSLQDPSKTSLKYEKKIWKNPKRARINILFTLFTMFIFLIAGLLGFIMNENVIREFSYGSIVLAIGLLGYLKLQMEILENHQNKALPTHEQNLYFDTYSDIYNEIRPEYSEEVFAEIAVFLKPDSKYNLLEIGAGHGLATDSISRIWTSKLTLIEPGKNLYRLLKQKYGGLKEITIINDFFENVQFEKNSFDAIFAATSFHWLPAETKFTKSYDLLKNNGLLIVFWNNYSVDDSTQNAEIQKIYQKYTGNDTEKSIREIQQTKIENRKNEIVNSRLFQLLTHKIIESQTHFSASEYIKLLKTFPDHTSFPNTFFDEISNYINHQNNALSVRIVLNLDIAQKISR